MNMDRLSKLLDLRMHIQRLQSLREVSDAVIDSWAINSFREDPHRMSSASILSDATLRQMKSMVKRDIEERLDPLLQEFEAA